MKALLISRDSQLHAEIASQGAARVPPLHIGATRASLREALDRLPADAPAAGDHRRQQQRAADADLLDRLCKQYPAANFILLTGAVQQQDLLIRAMRAGVREVLQLPLVHHAFHEALDRIASTAGVASHARRQGARLHRLQGRQRRHFHLHQFRLRAGHAGGQEGAC